MVNLAGVQRESDGVVAPVIGVRHDAPGGKRPDFGHAEEVGKREGMAGSARSNDPGGLRSVVAVDGRPSAVKENRNVGYGRWPSSSGWELLPHRDAAKSFTQTDRYIVWRLRRLLIKKRGRNLRAGQVHQWTEDWFNQRVLYRLRGTIRYPKAA